MQRKGGPSDPWPDYHRGPSAIAPRSRKASSGAWLTPPPHHDDDHITRSQPFYSGDSLTVDVASRSPSAQTRSTTQDSLTTPNNITSPQVSSWFATGTLSPASAGTAAPPGSRNRDDATARSPPAATAPAHAPAHQRACPRRQVTSHRPSQPASYASSRRASPAPRRHRRDHPRCAKQTGPRPGGCAAQQRQVRAPASRAYPR